MVECYVYQCRVKEIDIVVVFWGSGLGVSRLRFCVWVSWVLDSSVGESISIERQRLGYIQTCWRYYSRV